VDDLRRYITDQTAGLFNDKRYGQDFGEEIASKLATKSQGTFLWASFVINDLRSIHSKDMKTTIEKVKVEEALERMPSKLGPYNERLLRNNPLSIQDDVTCLFQILQAAKDPLTKEEISLIFTLNELGPQSMNKPENRRYTHEWLFGSCKNLVSVDEDSTVRLIHQSFHDYLQTRNESW
jgi:hypothetical protein